MVAVGHFVATKHSVVQSPFLGLEELKNSQNSEKHIIHSF